MVPFAGWRMPVQYQGIIPEHRAVRTAVGVFDISHMGQVLVSGERAEAWLDSLLTNTVAALPLGTGQYTLLLNEEGGVIDDLILYRLADDRYLLVINAAKTQEDLGWMRVHLSDGVTLDDLSRSLGGLAIQGPESARIAESLFPERRPALPPRNGVARISENAGELYLCRTGYTGEDGFELFAPWNAMPSWWDRLMELDVTPCGLGARDTLRLEMGYPLNGADLTPHRTPLEAGLGVFVDAEKEFVGSAALSKQRQVGIPARLAGLQMEGPGPPLRAGYPIFRNATHLGELTSGCLSPSLGYGIGMAYLPPNDAKPGRQLEVEIRGRRHPVLTVKKPFYRK